MTQSSCLCGANRISYGETPILNFRCHCLDERKLTGAAFALNILWSTDELKVLSGELKTWSKVANSGNTITNQFVPFASPAFKALDFLSVACAECGSLLYRTSDGYPGVMVIKAGCIDGKDASLEFVPQVELFTRSRVPWVPAIEGAKQEIADFTS
ncbi:hypothetical protein LHYA1_G000786 [Lachnellula hyalina]|uniref:CENP-V/GFA domain-containing protein n=1 Tax=Lachnellula hyalina TaxID=1316788 RepID=A0A8H8RB08_9HELO|nr:uncharacterized protein LHYA1_G000786 [Lachnellula hyalina]TVY30873.1 hypothetical protein LHYA1_G000786 [Lachnellula hyalina]